MNAPPVEIREARTADVSTIRHLVDEYAADRILLSKATVTLYEDVQEFYVAEVDGTVVGCGALHVLWEDLAEVRTLAVDAKFRRRGIGDLLLRRLLQQARHIGVTRVFCLTFEVSFFSRHGFSEIDGAPATAHRAAPLFVEAAFSMTAMGLQRRPVPGLRVQAEPEPEPTDA